MTVMQPQHPSAAHSGGDGTRLLAVFVAFALAVGGSLLALSTIVDPGAPFLLASVILGLAVPAVLLTQRERGWLGVRHLLRDCVRPPSSHWWLLVAAFGIPAVAWTVGVALGGAKTLDPGLVGFYVVDLVIGALVINIWEEMAWTGFFQRRAAARWGAVGGALVTSLFFTGIHVPLAVEGTTTTTEVVTNVLLVGGVALGVRLLVARLDPWTGGSLLTIGLMHSSFNATESLLEPTHDWVRIVTTIGLGIAAVAVGTDRQGR